VVTEQAGKLQTASLQYSLKRTNAGMELRIAADKNLGQVAMRLGPFAHPPKVTDVRVNGKVPTEARVERSGDSWWMRFAMPVAKGISPPTT
jgi:hypothetical protein